MLRLPGTYRAQGDTFLLIRALRRSGGAQGCRVLDVGTGGGALALSAVRAGARSVTAVDLSRLSLITTRLNSLLHRARVELRHGDLFDPVRGRRFDLVLANPPYVPSRSDVLPRRGPGRAWDAGRDGRAVIERICDDVAAVLVDGGRLLMVHSALADEDRTVQRLRDRGFRAAVVDRAPEPFGPVMRRRAALLRSRGLLRPDQDHEELVVVEARR
ncbi:HemK2/MTQ2 family protein methyltransferase [Kineococcus gynurae]|uniref:HemK2/MTQ2 family protein methyltransferase n=1 Tax=Kineococcus gynurae TaxID=452979 RepID=A0ABV5LRV5_9ACTN